MAALTFQQLDDRLGLRGPLPATPPPPLQRASENQASAGCRPEPPTGDRRATQGGGTSISAPDLLPPGSRCAQQTRPRAPGPEEASAQAGAQQLERARAGFSEHWQGQTPGRPARSAQSPQDRRRLSEAGHSSSGKTWSEKNTITAMTLLCQDWAALGFSRVV
ncbi:uncharacterized protein WM277_011703 [Molossus nigricans]